MSALIYRSAAEIANLVRSREVSATEVVKAHLDRIEQFNPSLNAITHVDVAGALDQASRVSGGRLAGVPLTIKSSINVEGLRCECGSRFRRGYVAERDGTLVSRLRAEGAVILGTTNTPDMLMAYESDNYLYGRTNNPWDLDRTAGGSSGGESAAIAAGLSVGGFGSDGGGSIRVPAHYTGICGLKPTPGLIPRTGHWPPCIGPSAHLGLVGPMAREAADLQLLLEVTAGPERHDPSSAPVPVARPDEEAIAGTKIGWYVEDGVSPVTPETRAAVHAAAHALEAAGFNVAHVEPQGLPEMIDCWKTLFQVAGATLTRPLIEGREDDLHPLSRLLFADAAAERSMTYRDFLNAWVDRDRLRAKFLEVMEDRQVLICPTASVPAPLHGEHEWEVDGVKAFYPGVFSYCQAFNLASNPALVVPVGQSPEGLPIGVQLVGRHFEDPLILALASKLQTALGEWRQPSLKQ